MEKLESFLNESPICWNSGNLSVDAYSEHYQNDYYNPPWENSTHLGEVVGRLGFAESQTSSLSSLPALCTDPGFAERAVRFSCFTNPLTDQLGLNETELPHILAPKVEYAAIPAVSRAQFRVGKKNNALDIAGISSSCAIPGSTLQNGEFSESRNGSSISEQNPSGKILNVLTTGKRKWVSCGKAKEVGSQSNMASSSVSSQTATDRMKEKKGIPNPSEPPKDYIHVRARRGQATDSHSLAERVRREKISERMKLLQDLVPGCDKITGKALMLDEIINYVQSLQRQVEFLSMKLSTINPRMEFNRDAVTSKEMLEVEPHLHTSDLGISEIHFCAQPQQGSSLPASIDLAKCFDVATNQNPSMVLSPMDAYDDSYFPGF